MANSYEISSGDGVLEIHPKYRKISDAKLVVIIVRIELLLARD
jgi:hypothetical protein